MFSFGEIVVIVLVALVVLGPRKTHALVRQIGLWAGRARVYWQNLSEELERETDTGDLMRDLRATHRSLKLDADKFRSGISGFKQQIEDHGKSFQEEYEGWSQASDSGDSETKPAFEDDLEGEYNNVTESDTDPENEPDALADASASSEDITKHGG